MSSRSAPRSRSACNWLWVALPPAGTVAFGLFALYGAKLHILLFMLVNVLVHGFNFAGHELVRRPEAPARAGWVFGRPFRRGCARAGRLLAVAAVVAVVPLLVRKDPVMMPLFARGDAAMLLAEVLAATLAFSGVRVAVQLARDTPAVALTQDGLVVGSRRYTWQHLHSVELNGDRWHPRLDVLLTGRARPVTVRPESVDVSLLFLLDLVGHHLARPQERASIGDDAAARRVHAVLLQARLAAGLSGGPTPIVAGPLRLGYAHS